MSDKCKSNGNDYLSNFNTLEIKCLHSRFLLVGWKSTCHVKW